MKITLLSAVLLALTATASADVIHKTDGTSIEDCTIVNETLADVTYKAGGRGSEKAVASAEVLKVEYDKLPAEIDRAQEAINEGLLLAAVDDLTLYLEGIAAGKKEKRDWAPPLAVHLLIEQYMTMGELDQVLSQTDVLINEFADSRYVPDAYLTRARAFFDKGEGGKSTSVLDSFGKLINEKTLSRRWRLECDLGKVIYDTSIKGEARRDKLATVSSSAGSAYPTVSARADVAEAHSFIDDKKFADAEKILARIIKAGKSDLPTKAAAYSGMGDCLFNKAAALSGSEAKATLKDALLSYLRVVVIYKDQTRYVPKSMFFAARCFDLLGEDQRENALTMYRRVRRDFPESNWSQEAKTFLKSK